MASRIAPRAPAVRRTERPTTENAPVPSASAPPSPALLDSAGAEAETSARDIVNHDDLLSRR